VTTTEIDLPGNKHSGCLQERETSVETRTRDTGVRNEQGYLERGDGTRLFYQCWVPEAFSMCMVIVHGLGEHSGRYANPVSFFTAKGFAIYAMDNRGHGRSSGIRGHVNEFKEYRDDLASFVETVRAHSGKEQVLMVGHSLGGLISLSYTLASPGPVQGLVLSSPGLRPKKDPPAIKAFLGRVLSRLLPSLTLSNEIDPQHICRDPDVVQRYVDDPLVHNRVSTRFYTEFMKESARVMAEAPRLRVPLLLMQAGGDLLVDPSASREFYERAGSADKTFRLYDHCYHELFNEPEKERVFQDMEAWILERFPAGAS
jgi:acylglycerol lipase